MGERGWRRWLRLRRDPAVEVDDELRFHLEAREREYRARGMDAESARRAALERLGDMEPVRSECASLLAADRRGRERRVRLNVSWLDVKLGVRMLVKHPGLSLVGGIGMAVAVAIGAAAFGIIYTLLDPALPLEGGDRIVAIDGWEARTGSTWPIPLHDVAALRERLRSFEAIGAYRRVGRNVIADDGGAESLRVTEMSAAGFDIAGVRAFMGRVLVPDDERASAPPVVVIGYDVWRSRFAQDAGVLGRTIRLGGIAHTIVGVMPAGFAFPQNDRYWTPLRLRAADFAPDGAPEVEVFGRLVDGVSLASAQAELATVGAQLAAANPDAPDGIQPRLQPYTHAFVEPDVPTLGWMLHAIQALLTLLLVIVCVNVAVLMYARTVTRLGEITVRTALGASRARIIGQLFAESMVLAAVASAVGLGAAALALRQLSAVIARLGGDQVPFWFDFRVSAGTVLYVAVLVVLAAVIVGVVPAAKATGRRVRSGLQQLSGGGGGVPLGRTWTALIAAQVAFAVAALPAGISVAMSSLRELGGAALPSEDAFAVGALQLDQVVRGQTAAETADSAFRARYALLVPELMRRLEARPAVGAVTFSMRVPGTEPTVRIEIDRASSPREPGGAVDGGSDGDRVGLGRVDVGFFDVFGVAVLAGRGFDRSDVGRAAATVVVNRSFVEQVAGGANVLGRRIRTVSRSGSIHPDDVELGPWREIVGVVEDFPAWTDPDLPAARMYEPIAPGDGDPVNLAVRLRAGTVADFAATLRTSAAAVDPWLRVASVRALSDFLHEEDDFNRILAYTVAAITLSVLLLSAAGVHALMSFTVARRRREIGIRAALGAEPGHVLRGVLVRAFRQVAIGAGIGLVLAVGITGMLGAEFLSRDMLLLLLAVFAVVLVVALIAALGPAREGLRIQPVEALREL